MPPILAVSQVGFLSGPCPKRAFLVPWTPAAARFKLVSVETCHLAGGTPDQAKQSGEWTAAEGPIEKRATPFGVIGVMDFSSVLAPGHYRVQALPGGGGGPIATSVPFFIRCDLYLRTAYEAFSFSHIQRCGCAIPGWHDVCHLDDARRRDNGAHVDTVGGWHDAGDLRKWMVATMWQALGMLHVRERWRPDWHGYADDDILDELTWGNLYFRKMQDPATDLVWNDVGGGVNGDNSDNHWTDNRPGTPDDRYLNTDISSQIQWCFAWMQARIRRAFKDSDPAYAEACLAAGRKAYAAACKRFPVASEATVPLAYALLAAIELWCETGENAFLHAAQERLGLLIARQETGWAAGQKQIRGFFYNSGERKGIVATPWDPATVAFALLAAAGTLPGEGARAQEALRLYFDACLMPLAALSPMRVLPYGLWLEPETHDHYRPFAGSLTYRFFHPVRTACSQPDTEAPWWNGPNGHLLGHAAALLRAARLWGNNEYRDLALAQLQWVHGANPLGVSTITGHGLTTVYPHTRYVGLIPSGVTPGISGDRMDNPVYGRSHSDDWQTTEYWSPSQAGYLMAIAELHDRYDLGTDIGRRRP